MLLVVWFVLGYLSFRSGVEDANARLPKTATSNLAPQDGMLISKPSLILLLGADGDKLADARRSDSILLLRTDPSRHRMTYLSIPRDLRVDIPGYGANKINAAYQLGGPALTLKTVTRTHRPAAESRRADRLRGLQVRDRRDSAGIEVDVPKPILSNKFACPYATQARCEQWPGWRFGKGKQTMDGRRALIYSRIRENRLNPADNDLTRAGRQQAVEAMTSKLAGPGTFFRLPFIGGDLAKPLTTDLSAGQLMQLGWVSFRANDGRALHCRLGGEGRLTAASPC